MSEDLQRLMPVLVHIQAALDQDLSLERLAKLADWSPFHFHRRFRTAVGETVKQYTLRLRLERAAVQLILLDSSVLDIALGCGFDSHDGFTRAFKRRFGQSPRDFRVTRRRPREIASEGDRPPVRAGTRARLEPEASCFRLSPTRVHRLEPQHLAFIRHVGPYESVSDQLWAELDEWASRRLEDPSRLFLGIAQDPPGVTPPDKLRFDAALRVRGPFRAEGRIGHQVFGGGTFAITTHVGHFATLPKAYRAIVSRLLASEKHQLLGGPTLERYHTSRVNQHYDLNHTEIYLPVTRKA